MRLLIDPSAALPLYRQVADAIRAAIASGRLGPDQDLPSVRDLAADNGVNFHTVARAYQELEEAGLVVRQRGGPYRPGPNARTNAGEQRVREGLDALAREALALCVPVDEMNSWWEEALKAVRSKEDR